MTEEKKKPEKRPNLSKTEARELLSSLARDETVLRSTRLEALRLYAEFEGWIGQPPASKTPCPEPKTNRKES